MMNSAAVAKIHQDAKKGKNVAGDVFDSVTGIVFDGFAGCASGYNLALKTVPDLAKFSAKQATESSAAQMLAKIKPVAYDVAKTTRYPSQAHLNPAKRRPEIFLTHSDFVDQFPADSIKLTSNISKTPNGQNFILYVIEKSNKYYIYIAVTIDDRLENPKIFKNTGVLIDIPQFSIWTNKISKHMDYNEAKNEYNEILCNLTTNSRLSESQSEKYFGDKAKQGCFFEIADDDDAFNYPDKYFRPGDHVHVNKVVYNHAAIYIGNKEVIQVSDPEKSNNSIVAKRNALVNKARWDQFHDGKKIFTIYFPFVKKRSDAEIVKIASGMINELKGEYNPLFKNCQHFATYCQLGCEICLEKGIYAETVRL